MIPFIDTVLMAPGATALVTIGPATLGVAAALIVGVAWMARETAEELRRTAARDWERRAIGTPPVSPTRLAA
jgi:hypothetical protein